MGARTPAQVFGILIEPKMLTYNNAGYHSFAWTAAIGFSSEDICLCYVGDSGLVIARFLHKLVEPIIMCYNGRTDPRTSIWNPHLTENFNL